MSKPKKFNFEERALHMVKALGAESQPPYNELTLQTLAGPMRVHPYDTWMACRFEDVERAKKLSPAGSLNPFSGKWNWHYTKPGENDLEHLYVQLCGVIEEPEEVSVLLEQFEASKAALPQDPDLELLVRLSYQYRDGDNYKVGADVYFEGAPRWGKGVRSMLLALDSGEGRPSMIPGMVGLEDLQDSFQTSSGNRWDPDRDHPWHEVTGIEMVQAGEGCAPSGSFDDFAKAVFSAAFVKGWDESYKPPFYPEMAARQKSYERSMRESAGA